MKNLILLISIASTSLFAHNNLIQDINLDTPSISREQLNDEIAQHSLIKSSYISIGESHLQADTALPINFSFAEIFFSGKDNYILCTESIDHVLRFPAFKELQKRAKKTYVSQGNNPHKTDFVMCNKKKRYTRLYYSGFFHQFPFARAYPKQFAQPPVIAEPGNNIWKQTGRNGLFVTQIEMIHMESSASFAVFNDSSSAEELVSGTQALDASILSLKDAMLPLNDRASKYKRKLGVILTPKNFPKQVQRLMPQNSYMVFTDLLNRHSSTHLHFLKHLAKLPNNVLNYLLNLPPNRTHLVSSYMTPSKESDSSARSGYGTTKLSFELGTYFFQFKYAGLNILISSQPSHNNVQIHSLSKQGETELTVDELAKRLN